MPPPRPSVWVSLLPVRGLLGSENALDEGLGKRTEGVLSESFFLCDGSNVEAGRGGPAVEGSNVRSRSSNAGKRCSTVRSSLGAFGCACGRGESGGRQDVEVGGAGDGPCDDNRGHGEGRGEPPVSSQPRSTLFHCRERSDWQKTIPDPLYSHLYQSWPSEHHQELGQASDQTEVSPSNASFGLLGTRIRPLECRRRGWRRSRIPGHGREVSGFDGFCPALGLRPSRQAGPEQHPRHGRSARSQTAHA
jgi:hypothetical protein